MTRPKKGEVVETNSPFKRMRLDAHMTQEQLARDIEVAVSTVRRWEKGQTEPTFTIAQMKNFCKATEKSFADLPDSLIPGKSPA
ncbi:putative transcriptional regulator [Xenococcus sp. PCC 7305]|uniref:helix-turn-helix domain-containing protein n=1 Tax=Xenococcus sp. PCC 7305 TaxID=102125 RepID=UPI0002ACC69E|nr:helix-turn-helix transcriptional regulator [Xenococcus sp. PCC 7305]ELS02361.1 putative transcriptional regulator [Xenococcus sp. PCC 7305]